MKSNVWHGPFKGSWSGCFQAQFFQSQWEIVGPSICNFVRSSLGGIPLDPKFEQNFISSYPEGFEPKKNHLISPNKPSYDVI